MRTIHPVARRASVATLTALCVCALALFCFIIYARPTAWYSTNADFAKMRNDMTIYLNDVPIATQVVVTGNKTTTQLVGRNAVIVSGSALFPLVLQWSATLGLALCAAGLLYFAQSARSSSSSAAGTHKPAAGASQSLSAYLSRACQRARILAGYIAHYQLPPKPFWDWFCGGLSLVDAFFVIAWVGLAVNYLWHNHVNKFKNISASLPVDTYLARRLNASGKAFGECLRVMLLVMFYPVSRSNVLAWLFRTDHSTLVRYHRWMGYGTVLIATFHGLLYAIMWGAAGTLEEQMLLWKDYSRPNLTGLISLIAGLVMCIMSVSWMRRNYYWLFLYTHILGFVVWTLFALMHYKALATWIVPGLVLYLLDRSFRTWQAVTNVAQLCPADVIVNDCIITLKLRWPKGATIAAGQTIYIRCFSVSYLQAHPFTIASVAEEPNGQVSGLVHIKVQGPWTRALRTTAAKGQGLKLQLEGPYESNLLHPPTTNVVVMIAGGIGITPLKGLLDAYSQAPCGEGSNDQTSKSQGSLAKVPKVYLMWTSRKVCELQLLGHQLLRASLQRLVYDKMASAAACEEWLHTELYYTGFELDIIEDDPKKLCSSVSGHHLSKAHRLSKAQPKYSVNFPDDTTDTSGASQDCQPGLFALWSSTTPWYFAVAAVLSSFGAYGGITLAWYNDAYATRTTPTGANYAGVCAIQFFAIAAGGIIPPLMFFAACALFKRTLPGVCASQQHNTQKVNLDSSITIETFAANHKGTPGLSGSGSLRERASGVIALPGYKLCLAAENGDTESDAGLGALQLRRGRPEIRAMLQEVMAEHASELEIEVLVGGPETMYSSVSALCQELSDRAWWGLKGPILRCRAVAHQH